RSNLEHRITLVRDDELGLLGETLNQLSERLDRANWKLAGATEDLDKRVEERVRELRDAQQTLLRTPKLEALADLAAGVGHEVNNPLWTILGNVQLLRDKFPPESEVGHALADCEQECLRIQEI